VVVAVAAGRLQALAAEAVKAGAGSSLS
jgi:hypothetical protein